MTARYKAWTVFDSSYTGVVGLNLIRGMDVCVRLFCVFFCVYVADLQMADPPSKESYRV
jgi:hypothetical protein